MFAIGLHRIKCHREGPRAPGEITLPNWVNMALGLEDKKAIVAGVNEAAQSALSAVIADYRVTIDQMTTLRSEAHKNGVYLKVVRNTLTCRC